MGTIYTGLKKSKTTAEALDTADKPGMTNGDQTEASERPTAPRLTPADNYIGAEDKRRERDPTRARCVGVYRVTGQEPYSIRWC